MSVNCVVVCAFTFLLCKESAPLKDWIFYAYTHQKIEGVWGE